MAKDPKSRSRADARLLEILGGNVKQARQSAGLSQHQLAARAGISQAAISLTETGQVAPTIIVLYRLATALEVDATDLQRGLSS